MQSEWPALPELDSIGNQPKASPERRARNGAAKFCDNSRHFTIEKCSIRNFGALWRRPCADLTVAWPRPEISIRLGARNALDASFGAHLTIEQGPVKHECRAGILDELGGFAARVVGVEDEPAAAEPAMQHDAHRRHPFAIRRGERHGFGQGRSGGFGLAKPPFEQGDGVGRLRHRLAILH